MDKYILYIGGFQLPDKNAAALRVIGIAKLLKILNFKVIFLDLNKDINDNSIHKNFDINDFDYYSQAYPSSFGAWVKYSCIPLHVEKLFDIYKNIVGVIAYNYPSLSLLRLKRICKKRKIKLLVDCTEWYYPIYDNIHSLAVTVDTFLRMNLIQKRIDGMIAISEWLRNYYSSFVKTVVLPPVIDKNEKKWEVNAEKDLKESNINLCYIGNIGKIKFKDKIDLVIESFKKYNHNLILHIIGFSKEQFLENYPDEKITLENLKEKIIFYGRLSHLETIKKIKLMDYLILLREKNKTIMAGFPTKFVESISCGVPVITNDTSDLKKYIKNGKNGILVELDTNCISKLFKSLSCMNIEVNNTIFDYHNYISPFKEFLSSIF